MREHSYHKGSINGQINIEVFKYAVNMRILFCDTNILHFITKTIKCLCNMFISTVLGELLVMPATAML